MGSGSLRGGYDRSVEPAMRETHATIRITRTFDHRAEPVLDLSGPGSRTILPIARASEAESRSP